MATPTITPPVTPHLTVDPTPERRLANVEIVVPVFCEELTLAASVHRLHQYLTEQFPLTWVVSIVDNASTDDTWGVACRLAQELPGVRAVHLDQKGRGRALRAVWSDTPATVAAYMDVDLSTDLDALLPLVAPLLSGHSDIAIGSRLAAGARVVRGPKREFISRGYNLILRATFRNQFSDAQCGFKAIRADVARELLPLVEDEGWFFDTEMLVLAEHNGLRIHEVPVDWIDDADSRVNMVDTAKDDLKGVARVVSSLAKGRGRLEKPVPRTRPEYGAPGAGTSTGQLVHFAGIGVISTVTFAILFAALFQSLGPILADVVALSLCAVANLAANRRFTFGIGRGGAGLARHYTAGLGLALLPLVLALPILAVLGAGGASSLGLDLLILTAVNLTSSATRYHLLSQWAAQP